MESVQGIYERMLKINWFNNCGDDIINMDIDYEKVKGWNEAIRKCKSSAWSNVQMEARNNLTIILSRDWPEKDRMWNHITDQAKKLLKSGVTPSISKYLNSKDLNINVLQSVEWDILAAMMEHVYSPYVKPGFYTMLLKVYEEGHFPCGWKGKYPDGKLLIY